MNMRVKLFLDFVSRSKGPAQATKRDILDVRRAAQDLGRTRVGSDMARDMDKMARSAQRARREYVRMALEARKARRGLQVPMVAGGAPKRGTGAGSAGGTAILPGTRSLLAAGVSLYALKKAYNATAGSAISFEAAMADVKKKVNLPEGKSWADVEKMAVKNALKYGRSREEMASAIAEAGAADIPYDDMQTFIDLTTRAAVAWDMSGSEATQALAEIRAATGWNMGQLDEITDKINYLGDTTASKERVILDMFQRAGAAAEVAGVSFDVSLASLTALNSIGMREEVAARFFAQMAGKLRTATHLPKKAAAGFKMLGTTAEKVEKGMKTDSLSTMLDLLMRMDKSPDKAAAAIKIFGQEWWDEAARMGRAIPEIVKNMKGLQSGAWKGSAIQSVNVDLATTDTHLKQLSTLASEVGDRLGKWALPGINEAIEGLIETMDRFDKGDTWYQRQLRYEEARNKAYREAKGQPEPEPWDHDKKQQEINDWLDERGLGWLQPFSKRKNSEEQTVIDPEWQGKQTGISEVLNEQEGALAQINLVRQRFLADRDRLPNGPDRPHEQQRRAQIDAALERLDKESAPILAARGQLLAEMQAELAQYRQIKSQPFDFSGPRLPSQQNLTIGPGGAFSLGLGGGGLISSRQADYTLPKSAAQQAASGVTDAFNSDMSGTGRKAMSDLAAGITAGGAQVIAAARAVAGQANAEFGRIGSAAGGGVARLSGSLHDGATG